MKRALTIAALLAVGAGAAPAQAQTTVGVSSQPAGSVGGSCNPAKAHVQKTENTAAPFTVPGPGTITGWQMNTVGAIANAQVSLLVLRPATAATWTVVGADVRNLPIPLPMSNLASFAIATPIPVTGGETVALYSGDGDARCYWIGGATPASSTIVLANGDSTPAPGEIWTQDGLPSAAGYTLNLAATFVPSPVAPTGPASPSPAKKKKCKKKPKKAAAAAKCKRGKKKRR